MSTLVFKKRIKPILILLGFFIPVLKRFTTTADLKNRKNTYICDFDGFEYCKRKEANKSGETLWTCSRRRRIGFVCKVVVKTKGDFIVAQKNEHTCIPLTCI